jgi:hypothetical protein
MSWQYEDGGPCIAKYTLDSWFDFDRLIYEEMAEYTNLVYRGQTKAEWKLRSSLDRLYERLGGEWEGSRSIHLDNFKFATRGRRGSNPPTPPTDNDWWALGQHNGLATPLLDWTMSPFVAAYFAFFEIQPPGIRAVFAINQESITQRSAEIRERHKGPDEAPVVEFFRPLSDENARIVGQAGLFTHGPDGVDLEAWVQDHFSYQKNTPAVDQDLVMAKIVIPDRGPKDRDNFIQFLDRMNINHLSLFPDLSGSCHFANYQLMVQKSDDP